MKKILLILIFGLLLCKNNEGISFGTSFGFMSEKIPATFFEMTGYYSPNFNTELFASLSYVVFGGGLGIGAKYYLRDRRKTSIFISGGLSASILSDAYYYYVGPHVSTGLSVSFIKILNQIGFNGMFNIYINIGAGHVFYEGTDLGNSWYPFLNGEMKISLDF